MFVRHACGSTMSYSLSLVLFCALRVGVLAIAGCQESNLQICDEDALRSVDSMLMLQASREIQVKGSHAEPSQDRVNTSNSSNAASLLPSSMEDNVTQNFSSARILRLNQDKTVLAPLTISASKALHAALCLGPLVGIALVLKLLDAPKSEEKRSKSSHIDALTGVRAPLMLMIFLYHAGLVQLNVVGTFVMLSGTVLSASRITAQGEIKAPFSTASGVGKFILVRWLRVLPVSFVCYVMPDKFMEPGHFWLSWLSNFVNDSIAYCGRLLYLPSGLEIGFFWFVQAIMCLYAMYFLLEGFLSYLRCKMSLWWFWVLSCCFFLKVCTWACVYIAWQKGFVVGGYFLSNAHISVNVYTIVLTWIPDFFVGMVLPYVRIEVTLSQAWTSCADFIAISFALLSFIVPKNVAFLMFSDLHVFAPFSALFLLSLLPGDGISFSRRFLSCDSSVNIGSLAFCFFMCSNTFLFWCDAYKLYPEGFTSYSAGYGIRYVFHDVNTVFNLLAALFLTGFAGWAIHWTVERPISKLVTRYFG
eukprot:TRINITY_DN6990_c0_g1_i1.p1 TRINITY_DN6990_c0_g1~~TRINITY_DN6990_c0_g1_i1.p1  ORF type:complete len:530 (-),score=20.03 TRINITY_DN6990_c0_g1_i1:162-1751(-)